MSNIWHTADEKPMLHRDIILCGDGWSMAMDIIPETVNNICWANVEKWCYVDDLIKENERTRKALDVAVDALKEIDKTRSVANHKIGTQDKTLNSGIVFCWATPDEIHNTLKQITVQEQKDVK